MDCKYFLLAAARAFTFTSVIAEDEFHQKEVELMTPLFEDQTLSLKPAEVLDLLHKLEELYMSYDGGRPIGEAEQIRREVVFTLAARGEIERRNCLNNGYFVEFKKLIKNSYTPNIKHYLEYFMEEQEKACKSKFANWWSRMFVNLQLN